jgi:hypothetical protein
MDTLEAKRIVEKQGRRGVVRAIDLVQHLRKDGQILLAGRRENGDIVTIEYIATGEYGGVFGVFEQGVLHAQVPELMSFFIPKYVLTENTDWRFAEMLVDADIPFTLVNLRG